MKLHTALHVTVVYLARFAVGVCRARFNMRLQQVAVCLARFKNKTLTS